MFSIFLSTNSSITYYFIFSCSIHSDIIQEKSPGILVRFFEKRFAEFFLFAGFFLKSLKSLRKEFTEPLYISDRWIPL